MIGQPLGPVRTSDEDELTRKELTLDDFEAELSAPGRKRVVVRLSVQTAGIRRDFDRRLSDMRARHPWPARPASIKETSMSEDMKRRPSASRSMSAVLPPRRQ